MLKSCIRAVGKVNNCWVKLFSLEFTIGNEEVGREGGQPAVINETHIHTSRPREEYFSMCPCREREFVFE